MAATTSGWQYAVPNDTLVAWPAVSQAVADKLETNIRNEKPGLVLLASQSVSAVSSVIFNSAFNDTYRNYRILISEFSASTAADMYWNLRSGTTDISANYYWAMQGINSNSGGMNTVSGATSSAYAGIAANTYANVVFGNASIDLFSPKIATRTFGITNATGFSTYQYTRQGIAWHNGETAYDGIRFTTSAGTFACRISIFGCRELA